MKNKKNFNEAIYEQVRNIPEGFVSTYGDIAYRGGFPKAARAVGNALHNNPDNKLIPCHRVVNANGALAAKFGFGGSEEQKRLLEKEGVEVSEEYRVDLKKFRH